MIRNQVGRITKKNITLTEFEEGPSGKEPFIYLQVGIVGFSCTKEEFNNLHSVMSYYKNIEDFAECKITIKGEKDESLAI